MTVYASAPLCGEAKRELAREGGRAGDVRVRVACLEPTEGRGGLDLAAIGSDARRATEDSTAVAYIADPNPAASHFSHPILEAADIAQISTSSGAASMTAVLRALARAEDSASLRESVLEQVG